ncbi:MAG: hypothetical protein ACE5EZ_06005 [Thermodesulfobacteriota bacterium]
MQSSEIKTPDNSESFGNASEKASGKVLFNSEQQAKVQELIDDSYRKAFAKAQRTRSSGEDVEGLRREIEGLKEEKKKLALLKAVSKYNVVDGEEIVKLLEEKVRMDDEGNVIVVNSSGSAKINDAGYPVGMDDFLSQWLSERPHHLRSGSGSGAGSHGVGFDHGNTMTRSLGDPSSWQSMPREDLDRYLREGINIHGSAGQVYRFRDVKNPFLDARKRRFGSAER